MFKPCMVGSRINEIRKTELFNVTEPLEQRGVKQSKCEILYFDIAMNGVFYDLHGFTKRIFIYIA